MDAVAEYVGQQRRNAEINRTPLQEKWETNRAFFLGLADSVDKWKKGEAKTWRSKSFPGFTHQKVIYALAIVLDTVLSGGGLPFMYKPSGFDRNRVRTTGPVDPNAVERAIEDMTGLTKQQLDDCRAEQAYMKNVLSAGLYGMTYGKFIVYNMHRDGWTAQVPEVPGILDWRRLPATAQQWIKWEEDFLAPGYIYVPVWDIFRDYETENLQECAFIGQRQAVSAWWLRQKIGKAYFLKEQIEFAISKMGTAKDRTNPSINSNPETQNLAPLTRDIQLRVNDQKYFEHWGRIPRTVAEAFESDMNEHIPGGYQAPTLADEGEQGDEVEVCVCTMNDEVTVRYVRTKPDQRPYFEAKWEDPGDELAPRGVADNCKEMHMVLNGTFRAIEDNEKLSANVILAMKERYLLNVPNDIMPGLKLLLKEECDDARKAIQSVVIPSVTGPLMQLLGLVQKFLDDDSMVPRIAQGIREPGDQTAAEAAMRNTAASKYIGMAIRNLDQGLIEPAIRKIYDYDMADPAVQVGKGNYIVQALGFTSFQNKTERIKNLQMLLAMALQNDAFLADTNTREIRSEISKALDCDPDQFLLSEKKVQEKQEQNKQSEPVVLEMAGKKADVEKTGAETMLAKAQAVKALADARATTLQPAEPQREGPTNGLESDVSGGTDGDIGDGAGLASGLADPTGIEGSV